MSSPQVSAPWVIRLIGVSKLIKAALLVGVAITIFHVGGTPDLHDRLMQWAGYLRVDPKNHHLERLIAWLLAIKPEVLRRIELGTLVYALLYGTEGVGLLLAKTWAEWMTVITTGGFIPLEVFEVFHRPGTGRVVLLLVNLLVLGYLIYQLMLQHRARGRGARDDERVKDQTPMTNRPGTAEGR